MPSKNTFTIVSGTTPSAPTGRGAAHTAPDITDVLDDISTVARAVGIDVVRLDTNAVVDDCRHLGDLAAYAASVFETKPPVPCREGLTPQAQALYDHASALISNACMLSILDPNRVADIDSALRQAMSTIIHLRHELLPTPTPQR